MITKVWTCAQNIEAKMSILNIKDNVPETIERGDAFVLDNSSRVCDITKPHSKHIVLANYIPNNGELTFYWNVKQMHYKYIHKMMYYRCMYIKKVGLFWGRFAF